MPDQSSGNFDIADVAVTDGRSAWTGEEFAAGAGDAPAGVSRRDVLRLAALSAAVAALPSCSRQPEEKIVPAVHDHQTGLAGKTQRYATTLTRGSMAIGVVVTSAEGRPIKIEGNPKHPASLGATDAFTQAEVLRLCDPARSQAVLHAGETAGEGRLGPSTWEKFQGALIRQIESAGREAGATRSFSSVRILTGPIASPTLLDSIRRLGRKYPGMAWHAYDPLAAAPAAPLPADTLVYDFSKADVIVSLDCDFLFALPGSVRYARDFAQRRRFMPGESTAPANRLYVAEPSPTITGSSADHRLRTRTGELEAALVRWSATFEKSTLSTTNDASHPAPADDTAVGRWLGPAMADLAHHRGSGLLLAGPSLSPAARASVGRINEQLGNVGQTLRRTPAAWVGATDAAAVARPVGRVDGRVDDAAQGKTAAPAGRATDALPRGLAELAADLQAGDVEVLIVLDCNPAYDAGLAGAIARAKWSVHLGLYVDETARACTWHIPAAHELECWGDATAYDGTVSPIQPLIAPLYAGKSATQVLGIALGESLKTPKDLVTDYWRTTGLLGSGVAFDDAWTAALAAGILTEASRTTQASAARASATGESATGESATGESANGASVAGESVAGESVAGAAPAVPSAASDSTPAASSSPANPPDGFELHLRPSYQTWDGRYASNSWLCELPDPITKLVWDNALLVSPNDARRWHLDSSDVVRLRAGGIEKDVVVWITPGQADGALAVAVGFGRSITGDAVLPGGFNAFDFRSPGDAWVVRAATIRKLDKTYPLASTQAHARMEGRDFVRSRSADFFAGASTASGPGGGGSAGSGGAGSGGEGSGGEGSGGGRDPKKSVPLSLFPDRLSGSPQWGMTIDLTACIGCNACTIACQSENNIPTVGKDLVINSREMHWIRIDRYFEGDEADPQILHQPVPCMQCENAPCEVVCPVGATQHSTDGLNSMIYNRCIGTRYCSNNCPYKVRRFNFFQYVDTNAAAPKLQRNPEVTVRSRGVMEKCTYCVQRIRTTQIEYQLKGESKAVPDGSVVTACQQVCPTQAIVFGDVSDPASQVSRMKASDANYVLLEELNTRPRTSYLPDVRNRSAQVTGAAGATAVGAKVAGATAADALHEMHASAKSIASGEGA